MLFSENNTLLKAVVQDTHATYEMILSLTSKKEFTFFHPELVGYYNHPPIVIQSFDNRSFLIFVSLA